MEGKNGNLDEHVEKKLKDDYDGLAKAHESHVLLISLKDTLGLSSVEFLSNYHIIKMLCSMYSLKVIAFIKTNPGGKIEQWKMTVIIFLLFKITVAMVM